SDPAAQALISEFCDLVNFPYQQQQGYFAVGFYTSVVANVAPRSLESPEAQPQAATAEVGEFEETSEAAAPLEEPSPLDEESPLTEPEPWSDEEQTPATAATTP